MGCLTPSCCSLGVPDVILHLFGKKNISFRGQTWKAFLVKQFVASFFWNDTHQKIIFAITFTNTTLTLWISPYKELLFAKSKSWAWCWQQCFLVLCKLPEWSPLILCPTLQIRWTSTLFDIVIYFFVSLALHYPNWTQSLCIGSKVFLWKITSGAFN